MSRGQWKKPPEKGRSLRERGGGLVGLGMGWEGRRRASGKESGEGLPENACQDGDAGDDFGVDEALLGPGGGAGVFEVGANYACDYLDGSQYE